MRICFKSAKSTGQPVRGDKMSFVKRKASSRHALQTIESHLKNGGEVTQISPFTREGEKNWNLKCSCRETEFKGSFPWSFQELGRKSRGFRLTEILDPPENWELNLDYRSIFQERIKTLGADSIFFTLLFRNDNCQSLIFMMKHTLWEAIIPDWGIFGGLVDIYLLDGCIGRHSQL